MNHSTSEFKNSNIARKSNGGAMALIFLTVATIAASFVQITNII